MDENLGKDLLIAMDEKPASLALVRTVADVLPDPTHTKVTLIHYLAPVYWEYGGGGMEAAQELDKQAHQETREEEVLTARRFQKAKVILQEAGVSVAHIDTKEDWRAEDVADALLAELKAGTYSDLIIGRSHHNALASLLHLDLAHTLQRHTEDVSVWVIDTPDTE
jgi:hypothetical protein